MRILEYIQGGDRPPSVHGYTCHVLRVVSIIDFLYYNPNQNPNLIPILTLILTLTVP